MDNIFVSAILAGAGLFVGVVGSNFLLKTAKGFPTYAKSYSGRQKIIYTLKLFAKPVILQISIFIVILIISKFFEFRDARTVAGIFLAAGTIASFPTYMSSGTTENKKEQTYYLIQASLLMASSGIIAFLILNN